MTMIKLTDGSYVAADQISEVKVNDYNTHIVVITKDGAINRFEPQYRVGIYDAIDRLVAEINAANASP